MRSWRKLTYGGEKSNKDLHLDGVDRKQDSLVPLWLLYQQDTDSLKSNLIAKKKKR